LRAEALCVAADDLAGVFFSGAGALSGTTALRVRAAFAATGLRASAFVGIAGSVEVFFRVAMISIPPGYSV
jgi:hypothetical protein